MEKNPRTAPIDLETAQVSVTQSIQQVLDEVGRKARVRGLTPEILNSILKGT